MPADPRGEDGSPPCHERVTHRAWTDEQFGAAVTRRLDPAEPQLLAAAPGERSRDAVTRLAGPPGFDDVLSRRLRPTRRDR